ncbi:lysophospholipid acyltransferase family protein [uncultured Polaribacter sp.]|uniref:lysophospholipid acyltransferase family protein n=1 Tax=uncultured Polaribacter sp. TaxID=174711 RepID=UPI002618BF7D|nr:lysophospholipid acyltransferase family protein [uncultured Polaribacter sp.]
MQYLAFILVYPIIWLVSRLPMRVLYILSDFFYVIIYYVFKYRKQVVLQNISYAFPEKSEKEKNKIAKGFYKHFTDIFIESVKSFSMSEKEVLKRYKYKNPELIDKYEKEGKSIALVGAHLANWEWSYSLPLVLNIKVYGAYSKLRNEHFEKMLKKFREKFGVIGLKTSDTVKGMLKNYTNKVQGLYILLSDQSPMVEKTFYWSKFFGVKVPVHTGAEMISKKFNLVVINYVTKKIKRGYYETEFEVIAENPKEYNNFELTEKYLKLTEKNIKEQPELYLWSHNRFKHQHRFDEWQKMHTAKLKDKKK